MQQADFSGGEGAMTEEVPPTGSLCFEGEPVFYDEDTFPSVPGQIYSQLGLKEFGISGWCEYHFDVFFGDPEEEEEWMVAESTDGEEPPF